MKQSLRIAIAVVTLFLWGCTGAAVRESRLTPTQGHETVDYLTQLDRLVEKYGVRDAYRFPVPGYPYLRADRFLEGMKTRITTPQMKAYWVEWMRSADLESRRKEIDNLPRAALSELSDGQGRLTEPDDVYAKVKLYSGEMLESDRLQDGYYERLVKAVAIPDEYSTARRFFLLYPIASIPVAIGTSGAYDQYEKWHQTPPSQLNVSGELNRFLPRKTFRSFNPDDVRQLFDPARRDEFGLPKWADDDILLLAEMFAPVITQDVAADYDRFGRVLWKDGKVYVEQDSPAVYYYLTHVFLNGKPVVQMNYALWYSERDGENAPRIERGPLDGLTLRLTFDNKGSLVMTDVMNNCGCYYFFVPKEAKVEAVIRKKNQFEPLVPTWLPEEVPAQRLDLRVSSGWHQVQHVGANEDSDGAVQYDLLPYAGLESLPKGDDRKVSVFDAEGIMKDSWRVEPYIFFSMGIPKIGYMRQRGHHAIKMIGREHFTNPHLYDRNFIFSRE